MMPRAGLITALLAATVVTGCGTDTTTRQSVAVLKELGTTAIGGHKSVAPQQRDLGLTRAALGRFVTPVDLVAIETLNAQGIIAKIGTNQGVETWSSADHKTLSLRQGVIVATRGLGDDLMQAAVPRVGQLSDSGGTHPRTMVWLTGDDQPRSQRYDCRMALIGTEALSIVERRYTTRHMRETCAGAEETFTNDFWFQTGGKLRQSRQWVGETVGYVLIKHLSD